MISESTIAKRVWDDLQDEERRAELSHWRGKGKFKDDATWLGIGKRSRKNLDFLLLADRRTWSEDFVVLEWGSGGGANAYELTKCSSLYYGVDISQKNLNEAQRVCSEAGCFNFSPVFIDSSPDDIFSQIDRPVDLFLSTAVFQHFPSKEYGIHVLKNLAKASAPDAVGLVQIRYDDGSDRFSGNSSVEQYEKNFIIATTYKIETFWRICVAAGFNVLCVNGLNDSVKYITFLLKKGK